MSVQTDKKNVIETIGVLKTLTALPTTSNSLNQLDSFSNNKSKDPFTFLIELLISIVGVEILLTVISKLLSSTLKSFEKGIKKNLKSNLKGDLPESAKQNSSLSNGFEVPLSKIDIFGNLKVSTQSLYSKSVYGNNNSFERFLKRVVSTPGQEFGYPVNNPNLYYTFNKLTNNVKIRTNGSLIYSKLVDSVVDSLILFSTPLIVAKVYDMMFGTVSSGLKKSGVEIANEAKIFGIIDKMSENQVDDNFFKFNINDLTKTELTSEDKKNGFMSVDLGCDSMNIEYDLDTINNVTNLFGSSTLSESQVASVISGSANAMKGANATLSNDEKASVKNNFFREFLNNLKKSLLYSTVLSPQIRVLFIINDVFRNGGNIDDSNNISDDLKNKKSIIKCVIDSLNKQINQMLFELLKKEILGIAAGIATLYIKESAEKSILIGKSLFRLNLF